MQKQTVMRVTGKHVAAGVTFRATDDAGRFVVAARVGCITDEGRLAMDVHCVKCGMVLVSAWSFCPQCGASVVHEKHEPPVHQPVPAKGAFSGMCVGMIAAPILIITGVMLCLTGWGIFFGVPFLVLGILAPLYGPLVGMGEHLGKCPDCGTRMISIGDSKEHECPVCNKRFAIGDHSVVGAR